MQICYIPSKRVESECKLNYHELLSKIKLSSIISLPTDEQGIDKTFIPELSEEERRAFDKHIFKRFKMDTTKFFHLFAFNMTVAIAGIKNCLQAAELPTEDSSLDEFLRTHNSNKRRARTIINDRAVEAWIERNAASGVSDIDIGGYTLMIYVERICYWICAIACIVSIVKKCKDGDVNAVTNILIRYAIIYGCIFAVQIVLKWVWSAFQG